jgi:hypothetical protein
MDGIHKIGEFRGIAVYKDRYLSDTELKFGRGPKYPDSYYSGPAIYAGGVLVKPDGSPIEIDYDKQGYETKFILTGASMKFIKDNSDAIEAQMKEKYDE